MKKKIFIIVTLLVGVVGGFILAQYNITGKAQKGTTVDANEAKEIALKEVNGEIVEFEYDNDGLRPHYEVEVVKDNEKVDMDIDAKTGKVRIKEREMISNKNNVVTEPIQGTTDKQTAKQNQTTNNKQNQATNGNLITQDKAVSIAVNKVGGGTVTDVELDRDNGVYVFEVEIYKDNVEYDVDVNATTSEAIIVKEERKADPQQYKGQSTNGQTISLDKAISIAKNKAGGGNVVDAKLDMDNGIKVYEVDVVNGNTKFEFEIDAVTGKIVKLEKELIK